jgi:hypothetical protein
MLSSANFSVGRCKENIPETCLASFCDEQQ